MSSKETIKRNQYKTGCLVEKEGSIYLIYIMIKKLTVKAVNAIYKYKSQLHITIKNQAQDPSFNHNLNVGYLLER